MFNRAFKFAHLSHDPSGIAKLPKGQHMIMEALSNLAKFEGRAEAWRVALRNVGLKWERKDAHQVIRSLVGTSLDQEVKAYLGSLSHLEPRVLKTLKFTLLSGLRLSEALEAIRLIQGGVEGYVKDDPPHLAHYAFPEFCRRTKNAYITFLTPTILTLAKEAKLMTKDALRGLLRRNGLPLKTKVFRAYFATTLRDQGIPSEIVDLLQGRVGQSVFVRHYYKPNLKVMYQKVIEALAPLEAMA